MPAAFGAGGKPLEAGTPVLVNFRYGDATPIDTPFFVAARAYRVHKITVRILGTAASATGAIKKAPSGTAIASGTALHASTFAFDATTNTNVTPTLTATTADLNIAAGDCIGVDVTGTLTSATGVISLELIPLA